jgi:hypothetical protein
MDGQDGGQRKKPHGNPHPKRGSIFKTIITDLTGAGAGEDSKKSPGTTQVQAIVAGEPDRSDRGTGSGNEVRHTSEQGSVKGTHLRYGKLDRGSRSTLIWIDDKGEEGQN